MELLHRELLQSSIQQSTLGRLPQGVLQEIESAKILAREFFAEIPSSRIFEIDQKTLEDANYFAEDVVLAATQKKFYSLWLPKALGGGGWHPLSMYGFNFEMGSRCLGISNLVGAHYVGLGLVTAANAFHVLQKIIKDIRRAEDDNRHCVVSAAITEPNAGSDLEDGELIRRANVCTRAQRVDGGYIINGQKIFISNSSFASWHIVSAFEDLADPAGSVSLFAIPANAPGVSLGRVERKLGQSASPAAVLFFEDVFVPDEDVCFAKAQFKDQSRYHQYAECLLNDILSLSRAGVGCMAAGVLKRVLEILISYSESNRYQDGLMADLQWNQSQTGRILQNFVIARTLSWEGHMECYARGPYRDLQKPLVYTLLKKTPGILLEAILGRWLVKSGRETLRDQRLGSLAIANEKMISGWASLVKSACSDMAMEGVLWALEVVGSSGGEAYRELEKILRDVKLLQIYEGTNELNRLMSYKYFAGNADVSRTVFRE